MYFSMSSKRCVSDARPPRIPLTRVLVGSGWAVVPLNVVVKTDLNCSTISLRRRALRRYCHLFESVVPSYFRFELGLAATSALAWARLYLPGSWSELHVSLAYST